VHVLVEPSLGFLYWYELLPINDEFGLDWYLLTVDRLECVKDEFANPTKDFTKCSPCPGGSFCVGGIYLPFPKPQYWIDRSKLEFMNQIYRCPYNTCKGFPAVKTEDYSCWTIDSFFFFFFWTLEVELV
jgi:hypothetical protein